jgi:DNA-binding LacI/PurR family transcriptional regulator
MAGHLLSLGHKPIGFIIGNALSLASEKASCGKVNRCTNVLAYIDDMVVA